MCAISKTTAALGLHSSGMLRGICFWVVTDVSGQSKNGTP
jgi:hypothetical protein